VRPGGDHEDEMKASRLLHDDAIDAIVRGDEVHPAHRPLAAFAEQVRALGEGPVPQASPELAALLYGREAVGDATAVAAGSDLDVPAARTGHGRRRLSPLAKVGLGTLAVAGAVAAGAAGVLPAAANDAVRGAIAAVSPVEFGQHHDEPRSDDNFGNRVSSDATGESDGQPGVDGQQTSEEAPGATHRSGDTPGQSGVTGLDQANQTPAAPNAPDATGTGQDAHPGNGPGVTPGDPDGDGQPGVTPVTGDPHGPPATAPTDTRIDNP